jgi:hypothetical protein|tara:strand:+ start:1004 stop:1177 length:174 start_codon:yes stop_codon:yes gene_type:complete
MKVESAKYNKDIDDNNISINAVIDGQTWSVPLDTNNVYYAAILAWAEEDGNEIQAAE